VISTATKAQQTVFTLDTQLARAQKVCKTRYLQGSYVASSTRDYERSWGTL